MNKLTKNKRRRLQEALLSWYDRHRRVMPWRARRDARPDPYHVWLSEIMLQQTTVATVGPYFEKFVTRWPRVEDLAEASQDDVLAAWSGLGYYARARNLHACARTVAANGGHFPRSLEGLQALPGVGPYTAAAVLSIAYDMPAVAVDGNVERVVSRFFAIGTPLPDSKPEIKAAASLLAEGVARPGDFTQAFMDLGATMCTPRNPQCGTCPWRQDCAARAAGIAETLPRRAAKRAKPLRQGLVFVVTDTRGRVLIERRQGKGLYQNMYQLPTTPWQQQQATGEGRKAASSMPALSEGIEAAGLTGLPQSSCRITTGLAVRHSLTHFDLHLGIVHVEKCPADLARRLAAARPERYWITLPDIANYGVPQVMKKALALSGALGGA